MAIGDLLRHPDLWRADEVGSPAGAVAATSSGFDALDAHLPGNGWPRAGLIELMLGTAGIGELKLLAPALRALSRATRWIAWVNPPFIPYAPALAALDIDISRILLVHPRQHEEALWAMEQASKSGTCSAVLGWLDERRLTLTATRRLQLAAKQGGTLGCLFRPEAAANGASMAELRLKLEPGPRNALGVSIVKRRGGWPVSGLNIKVDSQLSSEDIEKYMILWRHGRPEKNPEAATAQDATATSPSTLSIGGMEPSAGEREGIPLACKDSAGEREGAFSRGARGDTPRMQRLSRGARGGTPRSKTPH